MLRVFVIKLKSILIFSAVFRKIALAFIRFLVRLTDFKNDMQKKMKEKEFFLVFLTLPFGFMIP